MAKAKQFETVQSSMPLGWKPKKKGEAIEGEFLGSATVGGVKKKGEDFLSHRIRLGESVTSTFGDSTQTKKAGEVVAVSGAMLDSRFDQIPTGAYVRITFSRMYSTERGEGREYQVDVAKGTKLLDPHDAANR